ncbi:histamine N-methyltransferase-like [Ptychodera flava]|uniref:histamine N-methyltransferase-like n=1 Tax=Ptychodera flava TaxID=63121 RepID=UPI00396A48C3
MAQEVKTLCLYEKEYFARFLTMKKYGYNLLHERRQTSIKKIFGNFEFCKVKDSNSALQVLAIGTSNGVSDIPIIEALISRYVRIEYTVVEPVEEEIQCFRELVVSKHKEGKWNSTQFKFNPVTIEKYLEGIEANTFADGQRFDVIHTQHCAYYFRDPGIVFRKLYGLLNEGGTLCNITGFGAWLKISGRIRQIYGSSEIYHPSATLREMMQQQLPEAQSKIILRDIKVKVNECFEEESKAGNEMLDFIVHKLDFRKTASREIVDSIVALLNECCLREGCNIFFPADEEVSVFVKV